MSFSHTQVDCSDLLASDESSMGQDCGAMNFFFCIPLMPKANASDWGQVSRVFNQTLRSLDNQTNKSFQVLLAAQDMPELAPDLKLDVVHLESRWTVEDIASAKLRDKRRKRTLLLRAVRERGGGYVMMLDADDLLSNQLVGYVLEDRDPNGYLVETGYAYDWKANLIAPIPGVWGKGFDNVCGSCSVINFRPDDLPPLPDDDGTVDYLSKHLNQHSHWKHVMREAGRPLKPLPFPAAVYVLNHDNNLHYSLAHNRQDAIPRKIRARQIPLSPALVEEFSLPSPPAPLAASTAQLSVPMFQDISDTLVPLLREKGLDGHLGKIWVYSDKCLVASFVHKDVKFAFDFTPSEKGLVSVDIVEKRHKSDFRVTTAGNGKERIAQDLPLGEALDLLLARALQVFSAVDRHSASAKSVPEAEVPPKDALPLGTERETRSMKIGVLTLPFNANIGGNLQGYALMEVLRQLGHQPVLINRRKAPKDVRVDAAAAAPDDEVPLISDIMPISHAPNRAFLEEHATPISREFHSTSQLSMNISRYGFDAIVVGSDQVWRPKYAKSVLPDFFLSFLPEDDNKVKRISYAASFGTADWEYDDAKTRMIAPLIARFDAVSVREDSGVMLCRDRLGVDSQHVLDPTMLLTTDHYVRLFSSKERHSNKGQLLAYVLDRNEDKVRIIDALSRRLSVSAFSTNGQPFHAANPADSGEGDKSVEGWLAAIHDASFVVTDSFHGTVFSILFNKPFMAYGNPKRGLARFTSLLKMFGLEDRLVVKPTEVDVERMLRPIDWDAVGKRLERLRADSRRFLSSALSGAIGSRKPYLPPNAALGESTAVDRPAFTASNAAWAVTSHKDFIELAVAPGGSIRGNLVWCDLPCPILKAAPYRFTINWTVRTTARAVILYVRNKATRKFHPIGTVAIKGASNALRTDSFDFSVPEDGFTQFMLGAVHFTGERAGAEIAGITVQKLPTVSAKPAKEPSSYAKNAEKLALKDNERYVHAHEQSSAISGARARLMYHTHAIEKGLSHADFRGGFGKGAIQKLANEMQSWLAAAHPTEDQFFKAAASVMHVYFERHKALGVEVSEQEGFFPASLLDLIAKADDKQGGVLPMTSVREATRVETNQDRSFLEVVYSRRSVREFTSEPVLNEDIERAVQIAQLAPSVCNRQAPRVHLFEDAKIIRAAVDLQRGFRGYKMPPKLLLVTCDLTAFLSPNERNQGYIDGGLFMMSLLLGLRQVGLGSCSLNTAMNPDREEAIREILKIPETEIFISFVAVGHYDPAVLTPISIRLPVSEVLVQHSAAGAH